MREEVFAYASGPFIDPDTGYDDYGRAVERLLRQGFHAVKPRGGRSPAADGKMVKDLRALVGDDIGLMVDLNQGYTRAGAIEAAHLMEGAGLLWIEEPLPPEDLAGYTALSSHCRVPLAGGEALGSLAAFREYLQTNAFAVLQPDPTVCGGFTGYQQVAALAGAYDLPVIPHSFGSIVGAAASLQLAAVQPLRRIGSPADYPFVELDVTPNPLLTLRDLKPDARGVLSISMQAGLGLDFALSEFEPWVMQTWSVDAD